MSFSRGALAPLALLVAALPAGASAQTNPIQSIVHADGTSTSQAANSVWYINAADCAAAATVRVRVSLANPSTSATFGSTPQVWIGTSCELSMSRSGTNASCVQAQTVGSIVNEGNNVFTFPLTRLLPTSGATLAATNDLCSTSSQGEKKVYVLPETQLSGDPQPFVAFTLTSDLTAPSAVSVTTTNPSGDNAITFEWDASTALLANDTVHFFALPGGCGSIGADAGVSDAGTADGGTGDAATASGFAPGLYPPLDDATYRSSTAGSGDSAAVDSDALGLADYGDTVAVGFSVRDAAGNYGVLSNIVCATRVQTYGLCDVEGDCPQGGCSVASPDVDRGDALIGSLALLGMLVAWSRRR